MKLRNYIIAFIIILLSIIVIYTFFLMTPRSYIEFSVAPTEIKVMIDKNNIRTIKNKDKINIDPGKHTIVISQDGFESYTKDVNVLNNESVEILVALKPLTDKAKKQMRLNENQSVIERFYGNINNQREESILKNYPIIEMLPYTSQSFDINACKSKKYPDDSSKIAICVTLHRNDDKIKDVFFRLIKNRGYNSDDYEIIWGHDYYFKS